MYLRTACRGRRWGEGLWVGASLTFIGLIIRSALAPDHKRPHLGYRCFGELDRHNRIFHVQHVFANRQVTSWSRPPATAGRNAVGKQQACRHWYDFYQHISGLLATLGLMFVGIGLFVSRLLRRTGLVIAVLALILAVLGILFGAVPGPVVILSVPIAIGLLVPKRGVQAPAAATT